MSEQDYALPDENNPIGKNWKEYWRALEQNAALQRETRRNKRAARRRVHKKSRKKTREQLRDWQDFEE